MQLRNLNFIAGLFIIAAIFTAQANAQTKKSKKIPAKKAVEQTMPGGDTKIKYTPDAEMIEELQKTILVVESKKG